MGLCPLDQRETQSCYPFLIKDFFTFVKRCVLYTIIWQASSYLFYIFYMLGLLFL